MQQKHGKNRFSFSDSAFSVAIFTKAKTFKPMKFKLRQHLECIICHRDTEKTISYSVNLFFSGNIHEGKALSKS